MDLGGTIKQCRSAHNYTLSDLSKKIEITGGKISVSHLSLIESNKRDPSLSTIESIAKGLDIPLSVLVFLAVEKGEVEELNASHVKALSNNIMELMSRAKV